MLARQLSVLATTTGLSLTPSTSTLLLPPGRCSQRFAIAAFSAMSSDPIRAQKAKLRKDIRDKLKHLENIEEQSQMVWERLFALPAYQNAKTIGLFLSMPKGEINTDVALHHAIQNGKIVYVPEVGPHFEHYDMDMIQCPGTLDFHKTWPTNKWNIPEPPPEMERTIANPGDIDVLVVPGLAFDRTGERLGQGKGYYDRFIEKMRKEVPDKPLLIAVGLQPQLVDCIPTHHHDIPMDIILLPDCEIDVTK